jgi:hypothetical protein
MDIPESVIMTGVATATACVGTMFLWLKASMNERILILENALKSEMRKREDLEKYLRTDYKDMLMEAHDREREHSRWLRRMARCAGCPDFLPQDADTDKIVHPRTPFPAERNTEHG